MRHCLHILLAILCLAAVYAASAVAPPNGVVILVDDLGYGDVSPFNPRTANRTPQLERMACGGLRLTSFYAAPVCSPSRAQLLTDRYAKRVGIPRVMPPAQPYGLNPAEPSIAAERLLALVKRMDADLGVEADGPWVRQPGRVAEPRALMLRKD